MESLLAHLARKERDRLSVTTRATSTQQPELAERVQGRAWCRRSSSSRTSARSAARGPRERAEIEEMLERAPPRPPLTAPPPPEIRVPSLGGPVTTGSQPEGEGVKHAGSSQLRPARARRGSRTIAGRRRIRGRHGANSKSFTARRADRLPGDAFDVSTVAGGSFDARLERAATRSTTCSAIGASRRPMATRLRAHPLRPARRRTAASRSSSADGDKPSPSRTPTARHRAARSRVTSRSRRHRARAARESQPARSTRSSQRCAQGTPTRTSTRRNVARRRDPAQLTINRGRRRRRQRRLSDYAKSPA